MKKKVVLSRNLVDLPNNNVKGNIKPSKYCKSSELRVKVESESETDANSVRSKSLILSPKREQGRFNVRFNF